MKNPKLIVTSIVMLLAKHSFSQRFCKDSTLSKSTCAIVDSILNLKQKALFTEGTDGFNNRKEYTFLVNLKDHASIHELITLVNDTDRYIKSYAFYALCLKKNKSKIDFNKIVLAHYDDKRIIEVRSICSGQPVPIWIFFARNAWSKLSVIDQNKFEQRLLTENTRITAYNYDHLLHKYYIQLFELARKEPVNNRYDSLFLNIYLDHGSTTKEVLRHLSNRYYEKVSNNILKLVNPPSNFMTPGKRADNLLVLNEIDIILKHDHDKGIGLITTYLKEGDPKNIPVISAKAKQYNIDPYTIVISRVEEEDSPFILCDLTAYIITAKNPLYNKKVKGLLLHKKKENSYVADVDIVAINKALFYLK